MNPPPSPDDDPLLGNRLSGLLDCALDSGLEVVEPEVPAHWEPPTPSHIAVLLPQYQIEHLIGRGGMGAVYKGKQITLQRPVAIKVLPAELARNAEFVARFHREAQLLASLSHQGIVTIFDFGQTTEGHLYFVMEYVDGTDLYRLIHKSQTKLDATEALSLTVQICEAMQYAHQKGVVHRDIKPANVLVTKDGRAKLADFGLAMKPADPDAVPQPPKPEVYFDAKHSPDVAAMRFTAPGAAMGTPDYAAPEVYEGRADERSDIYALGIMLYEMLTGAPPKGYFQLPSVMAPVDHRVDQVVVKALEIDPGARYQKVEEMKADVQAATQPLAKPPPQPPTQGRVQSKPPTPPSAVFRPPARPSAVPVSAPRSMRSRLIWAAVLLALAGGGYLLWTSAQKHPEWLALVKARVSRHLSEVVPAFTSATAAKSETTPAAEPVGLYLGNITPLSTNVGWGSLQYSYNDTDPNVGRLALLDGVPCTELLFTHPPARVTYSIPNGYNRFKAIGFGPTPTRLPPSMDFASRKSWKYIVEIDGTPVFESSELIHYPKGQVSIDVRIPEGAKTITLVTDGLGDTNSDHALWAYPKLYQEPVKKP